MIEELEQGLSLRHKIHIADPIRTRAAVLVPLFIKNGVYHLLFIQRTERVRDHKGQISFPGGTCEKSDRTVRSAALREAHEEIGLGIDKVKILGELDDIITSGSNYIISPVVGLVPYPYPYQVDHFETEEIIEVPLLALLEKGSVQESDTEVDGQRIPAFFFRYGDRVIWGATARILKQFLEIISDLREKGISLETE